MKKFLVILMVVAMLLAFSGIALAQQSGTVGATATLHDTKGTVVGTATFTNQGDNGVLITVHMNGNLKVTGAHGIHIDDVGTCSPTFDAAGRHFNPIGRFHPNHAGDLPNIVMKADGTADYMESSNRFTLTPGGLSILDTAKGTSLVIDTNPDNMTKDAVTNSGARIACGVIVAANGLSTSGTMTGTTGIASTTASSVVAHTNVVTSTAGVTTTAGAPTTLPTTGAESNGLPAVIVLMLGVILLAISYMLRRSAQAQ